MEFPPSQTLPWPEDSMQQQRECGLCRCYKVNSLLLLFFFCHHTHFDFLFMLLVVGGRLGSIPPFECKAVCGHCTVLKMQANCFPLLIHRHAVTRRERDPWPTQPSLSVSLFKRPLKPLKEKHWIKSSRSLLSVAAPPIR